MEKPELERPRSKDPSTVAWRTLYLPPKRAVRAAEWELFPPETGPQAPAFTPCLYTFMIPPLKTATPCSGNTEAGWEACSLMLGWVDPWE